MALFEIILRATYFGQQVINRWTYQSAGTPAAVSLSYGLTSAFGAIEPVGGWDATTVFGKLKDIVCNGVHFDEIQVENLYSATDFYLAPFVAGTTGNATGECMTPVAAYGFTTNRVRTDIRRATKRFAGVTEGAVNAGGIIDSGQLGALNTLAEYMSAALSYDDEGSTLTYTPVVLSKQKYTAPSGKSAYRYWPTESEQVARAAVGVTWSPYDTVRSQVSRQYGRGA